MLEKTLMVVEGEEACKLFDCFLTYKKLIGAAESPESLEASNSVTVEALPEAETALVEQKI